MLKETSSQTDLMNSLKQTTSSLLKLVEKFEIEEINRIPFPGSWTPAQVADHVTKSNRSIGKALLLNGTAINREIDERVPELKNVFLNFETKLKSPDFILPDNGHFVKIVLIANLSHSIEKLKENAAASDLSLLINHPAFGDISKFEILHFVLYHTQRHIHQLENIYKTIKQ
jgi:hypothetical protein